MVGAHRKRHVPTQAVFVLLSGVAYGTGVACTVLIQGHARVTSKPGQPTPKRRSVGT